MFTGLVETIGTLTHRTDHPGGTEIRIHAPEICADAHEGDSIAVSGVCLTARDIAEGSFTADAVPETLSRTILGHWRPGTPVNLERSMRADGRLGGHIVQGHVDGVGTLTHRVDGERWRDLLFTTNSELLPMIASKGSITVSGVSLTVTTVADSSFGVSLIPTTLRETTLGDLSVGDEANLEVDVLARYVTRALQASGALPAPGALPTANELLTQAQR